MHTAYCVRTRHTHSYGPSIAMVWHGIVIDSPWHYHDISMACHASPLAPPMLLHRIAILYNGGVIDCFGCAMALPWVLACRGVASAWLRHGLAMTRSGCGMALPCIWHGIAMVWHRWVVALCGGKFGGFIIRLGHVCGCPHARRGTTMHPPASTD